MCVSPGDVREGKRLQTFWKLLETRLRPPWPRLHGCSLARPPGAGVTSFSVVLLVSEAGDLLWRVRTKVSLTAPEADCEMKVSGTGQCPQGFPSRWPASSASHPVFPFHGPPLLRRALLSLSEPAIWVRPTPQTLLTLTLVFKGFVSPNSHMLSCSLSI